MQVWKRKKAAHQRCPYVICLSNGKNLYVHTDDVRMSPMRDGCLEEEFDLVFETKEDSKLLITLLDTMTNETV